MNRFHSLDALRGSMMLLGIVLHVAASYRVPPPSADWPVRDAQGTVFFDHLIMWIHSFRMPAFFLVSGFFASLLIERKGLGEMFKNRYNRILKPFVVGWLILFPLVYSAVVYAYYGALANPFIHISTLIREGRILNVPPLSMLPFPNTTHLWFLYFLFLFSCVLYVGAKYPWKKGADWLSKTAGPKMAVFWVVPTLALALLTPEGVILTSESFIPNPVAFSYYFLFFLFGVFFWKNQQWLETLGKNWWMYFLVSVIGLMGMVWAVGRLKVVDPRGPMYLGVTNVLVCWTMVFASLGFFVRFLSGESKTIRYLMDSAYFLYLAHLPLVIFGVGLLRTADLGPFSKFGLIFTVVIVLLLLAYNYLVRGTLVGAFLNGRTYEPIRLSKKK